MENLAAGGSACEQQGLAGAAKNGQTLAHIESASALRNGVSRPGRRFDFPIGRLKELALGEARSHTPERDKGSVHRNRPSIT
jgi:hypothetical protein